jgi:Txe/YoeB family toxin of toxin-antitoxin system
MTTSPSGKRLTHCAVPRTLDVYLLLSNDLKTVKAPITRASASPRRSSTGFHGYWSRRITDEHRLVHKIVDDQLRIAACRYHDEH